MRVGGILFLYFAFLYLRNPQEIGNSNLEETHHIQIDAIGPDIARVYRLKLTTNHIWNQSSNNKQLFQIVNLRRKHNNIVG
jgi:hypothetical protein